MERKFIKANSCDEGSSPAYNWDAWSSLGYRSHPKPISKILDARMEIDAQRLFSIRIKAQTWSRPIFTGKVSFEIVNSIENLNKIIDIFGWQKMFSLSNPNLELSWRYVWRRFGRRSSLQHDAYLCQLNGYQTVGWPTKRLMEPNNFVAAPVLLNVTLEQKCPMLCRRHPDWEYC